MKRTTKLALSVGTALSLAFAVAQVQAHSNGMGWNGGDGTGYYGMHGGGMGGGSGMHGNGMGGGYGMHGFGMGPQAMFNSNAGVSEEGLAGLKSELRITSDQESAWQGFAKSLRQQGESRAAWVAKMQEARGSGSLPELRARQDEVYKLRQTERQATTAALKDLYAVLTPEQKSIADRSLGGCEPGSMAAHGWGQRGGSHGHFR